MNIQTRTVTYHHEGAEFEALMSWDDNGTGPRPAVAIAHAWGGRSEFEQAAAVKLAELGYIGCAIDMYGKGVHGDSPEENNALMTPLIENRELLQARMGVALSALADQPEADPNRLAAIGYCFGGLCVLDLARSSGAILGVVSFHGLLMAPGNTAENKISAKVLCLHGYDDPMADPQSVLDLAAELSAAGADWQLHAYGNTVHAFTNPAANDPSMGTVYDANADRRSWQAMKNFLEEVLLQ